jgi:protein-S-isoprenylcysteine O-methyltransferase Ste14
MSPSLAQGMNEVVGTWRHLRAVALLPFMNTVAIPSVLLTAWPGAASRSAGTASIATSVAGALLIGLGIALAVHCILLFVRHGHGTLAPWDPTRELVGAGAYRYSRNPMKAGLFLILAGEALWLRSSALAWWFACFVVVNVVYIRLHEEPGLRARFGEQYRRYCARVPRWWPVLVTFSGRRREETP